MPRRMSMAVAIGWWIGWAVALAVVVLAAALLLAIIGLGRRIAGQADDITAALAGARENTNALFDVTRTNYAIDRTTRDLRVLRTGESETPQRERHEPLGETAGPVDALRESWQEREE